MSNPRAAHRMTELEAALAKIAMLGGNLPDERLTSRTGPNDAVSRGLMVTAAREIALNALSHSNKSPLLKTKDDPMPERIGELIAHIKRMQDANN